MLEFLEKHFRADEDEELKLHRVVDDFARNLVEAVARDRDTIDKLIGKISQHWKLYRINRVDRNILRMAIAELITFPETPGKVVLNEAIEIGKKYGAENSAAFINGILDRIHLMERRPASAVECYELLSALDQSPATD